MKTDNNFPLQPANSKNNKRSLIHKQFSATILAESNFHSNDTPLNEFVFMFYVLKLLHSKTYILEFKSYPRLSCVFVMRYM